MANTISKLKSVTDGQISKTNELIAATLRKSGLQSRPFQRVLANKVHGPEMIEKVVVLIRDFVERASDSNDMIVRRVVVPQNQDIGLWLMSDSFRNSFTIFFNERCLKLLPLEPSLQKARNVEVIFFQTDQFMSENELEAKYSEQGLKPADPYALTQLNARDRDFSGRYPNATHWRGPDGNWHYMAFTRGFPRCARGDESRYSNLVHIDDSHVIPNGRSGQGWSGKSLYFAGVRM